MTCARVNANSKIAGASSKRVKLNPGVFDFDLSRDFHSGPVSNPAGDISSTARPERRVQKRDAKPAIHALERSNRFFGTSVFGRGPDWSITRYEDPIDRRDLRRYGGPLFVR